MNQQQLFCPACYSKRNNLLFKKKGKDWHECKGCKTIFIGEPAPQVLGGDNEKGRNTDQANQGRLQHILDCFSHVPANISRKDMRILDYGCGSGLFVDYLKRQGYHDTYGYDSHGRNDAVDEKKYDVIVMVEVIEHLHDPQSVIDELYDKIADDGIIMIESSFRTNQNTHNLKGWPYVDHEIGHCSILSRDGLLQLMARTGFRLHTQVNNHVYLFEVM